MFIILLWKRFRGDGSAVSFVRGPRSQVAGMCILALMLAAGVVVIMMVANMKTIDCIAEDDTAQHEYGCDGMGER